jgi:hypothetical protein
MSRRYSTVNSASRLRVHRAHSGRIAELTRIRSLSLAPAVRIFARATSTGPMPVPIVRASCNQVADTGAPVGRLQILHRGGNRLDFDLHGLRQKLPGNSSQNMHGGMGMTDELEVGKLFKLATIKCDRYVT